ncbi:DUF4153 domain-containing protein [Nocardioides houyundeii]|uniref:DUF4153 domain-containing protein n=1 Tax=Nocardioides houyundeii TaxID=2045452 RepID=UPI000DF42F2B|nr:DUF4153 domain-containing protein [Nocardioides houyundeii]
MAEAHVRPLDAVTSIKTKLGVLVGVSVVVAALLGALGAAAGVPGWLTVPVAVALALGVTQLLAAGMTQPLRQMTQVAQQMARGDYSGRVRTSAGDEVGQLARAFNRMAEDLATVDRERRDLVATVSHELRTPLTAMTAVLENLADGVVPADRAHLAQALAQAERLSALVQDLLELSRVEAGVVPLAAQQVSVRTLVEDCVREVSAAGRGATYDLSVPVDLTVTADEMRLRQLLTNLLDNAARHSPDARPVRVSAGADGGAWWLEVEDHGRGVPEEDRERVFARFGTDPEGGGTGLGLAVSRWVATLHGGTLRFVDPRTDQPGARIRLVLPQAPGAASAPHPPAPTAPEEAAAPGDPTSNRASTGVPTTSPGLLDTLFATIWPEPPGLPGRRVVLAAAGVGLVAGAVMTFQAPGLAWALVLVLAGTAAFVTARYRRTPFTVLCTVLAVLLVLPVVLLAAFWVQAVGVLTAAAVFLVGVTRGRTVPSFVLAWVSWPLSSLRGLPWFGRSLFLGGTGGLTPAVVRTTGWSLLVLLVFGFLFASADALFASWVDAVVPSLSVGDTVVRGFVAVAVFGLTLAAAYLALNPPALREGARALPLANRFEWLAPVLLVDAVFAVFLLAQATVVFGGHDYLERTTGVTYADYVHQGFGQLTLATALTLLVVWAASRRAGSTVADRLWLRISLGLLCAFTLVVVASALYRMHVYQEAYGFTGLRLFVDLFEGWLGAVVLLVLVAGVLGHGRWLPRAALVLGAVGVLGLAALNPDAWVARQNLDRYAETGKLDVAYLQGLSQDAVPVIVEELPPGAARCAAPEPPPAEESDGFWSWNLGRARAEQAREDLPTSPPSAVEDDLCGSAYDVYLPDPAASTTRHRQTGSSVARGTS